VRKICIINQKGGVGKTTSAINIGAGLAMHDRKVLIVDLDAQGNIASALNIEGEKDMYHLMTENADVQQCTKVLGKNLEVIPSRETLTKTELLISALPEKEFILKKKLSPVKGYDYVLIDCPPSLSILNQNALLFAQEAFIPASTDNLGYEALMKMTQVVDAINEHFDHTIKITKVIPTLFDRRTKSCRTYLDKISSQFYEIVSHPIRMNSKLREAPEHGKSIFSYAKSSNGAKDYGELVRQILNEEKKALSEYPTVEDAGIHVDDPAALQKKTDPIKT